jgi:hypothetical protein
VNERFDAAEVAKQVESRLWRYLSTNAAPSDLAAVAESLFALPRHELSRLTAAHLADSDRTDQMLQAARAVLRELPSSVSRSEVELRAGVRQPVIWTRTYQRRYATGDQQRYVCRPPERAYDTPLARLVALALDRCAALPELAGLRNRGQLGRKVTERASRAARLRGHAKLADIGAPGRLPERTLASLRRHRRAIPLITWVRRASEALDDRSPQAMREVIQERLLLPSQESRLFELFVGFRLVDAFVAAGFSETQQRLVPNPKVPFARLRRGEETLEVYWQRSLWAAAGVTADGHYKSALTDAGMSISHLCPDFVLKLTNPARLAFVEVKLTTGVGEPRDRVGIRDALAYSHDAESLLADYPHPHGLVVGWNSDARPGPGEFVVAGQGVIPQAVSAMLSQWSVAAAS